MTQLAAARFQTLAGGTSVPVDFNPATLKITVTNKLQDPQESGDGTNRQQTRTTTTKLEIELVFDSTESGADVRDKTGRVKALAVVANEAPTAPPRIAFVWGRFRYEGVIESLNETLEFWSAEGVPLRAALQITVQGVGADTNQPGAPSSATLGSVPAGGFGATKVATDAGDPRAARRIAAANGLDSMRMPGGGSLAVGGGVALRAAAGFQASAGISAGASAGFGASAGIGVGGGIGGGASAGIGFGVGAAAGGGASAGFGVGGGIGVGSSAGVGASAGVSSGISAGFSAGLSGTASAGTSASAGAFAGLGSGTRAAPAVRLDPSRLLPRPPAAGATFDVTGRVSGPSSPGLSANVSRGVRFGTEGA